MFSKKEEYAHVYTIEHTHTQTRIYSIYSVCVCVYEIGQIGYSTGYAPNAKPYACFQRRNNYSFPNMKIFSVPPVLYLDLHLDAAFILYIMEPAGLLLILVYGRPNYAEYIYIQ